MDTLPIETLQHIFELACTDGGFTGNSLSFTSKHIRAAARRARFHTLRVAADSDTFPEFVAFFERECNYVREERPRVRHLYLTLASPPNADCRKARALLALQEFDRFLSNLPLIEERLESPLIPPSPGELAAVQELVQLVAPDLWSLVVHTAERGPRDNLQYSIFEHTFPLLREAAFIGLLPPWSVRISDPDRDVKLPLQPIFPSTTHLYFDRHLSGGRLSLASWAALAPSVTHLRVSGIYDRSHARELAEEVGVKVQSTGPFEVEVVSTESPSPSLPSMRTYPRVQYLLIEPDAKTLTTTSCLTSHMRRHATMWKSLSDIVCASRRAEVNIQLTLLEAPDAVPDVQYAKALGEQWVERIEGGEGWWSGLGLN